MTTNEQLTWEQRLQYPTRIVTFDSQPDVKEYIMSYDEIQELNKVEKNLLLDQAIEIGEKMKKDNTLVPTNQATSYVSVQCKECGGQEDCECESFNQAIDQTISKLKELKE